MGEAAEAPGFHLKPAESQPVGMSLDTPDDIGLTQILAGPQWSTHK